MRINLCFKPFLQISIMIVVISFPFYTLSATQNPSTDPITHLPRILVLATGGTILAQKVLVQLLDTMQAA